MNGAQRYNFEQLKEQIDHELSKEQTINKLYKSTNGLLAMLLAIIHTKGKNWAAQILNEEGEPLLTKEEQVKFTEAFEPYLDTILDFFGVHDDMAGGVYLPDTTSLSGMSKNFIKKKIAEVTRTEESHDPTKMLGVDNIYAKIIDRIGTVNSTVNDYASKYGILKLEKEHDLEPDVRLVSEPAALAISDGIFSLSTAAGFPILPNITMEILSKIKIPFRTIIFIIYLTLDIARIAIGVSGPAIGRKIMSVLLSILELLRGDWKKATLTFLGYFGMMPMLFGELIKVFLTMFRMLAPQIQQDVIFGSLDATKSIVIGILLTIFQVTAPEEIRLPLIGSLEKIAQHKANMDGVMEDIGLSARPDYLSPTWNDLNNIQAVMSDDAYICSCEFQELVNSVNKTPIIQVVLQILRIPVTQEMITYKCGNKPCKEFVESIVSQTKEETEQEQKLKEPISNKNLELPINLNTESTITQSIDTKLNKQRGGRILHSIKNKPINA